MKILIAYYSRTGGTEKLAEAVKKEFEVRGHSVDVEKVKPVKEHGFLAWWHIRMVKGECDIQPLKVKDVSKYDAICIGSPNWTRLSLPMARYLREIKGLKYKNIGFFSTTVLPPVLEWFIISAYLLDLTLSRIIDKKNGRIIESILLSSTFERWNFASEYGEKAIKKLCDKITSPIRSLKDYFLSQKEISDTRLLVILFSALLFSSLIFQIVSSIIGSQVFTWNEYFYLFTIGFFAYFAVMTMLAGKIRISWGKYLTGISLACGWTLTALFLTPALGRPIILGYILIFIFISFFRDLKAVLFTGLITLLGYSYLFFYYPQKEILQPSLDFPLLFLSIGLIGFITQSLEKHFINVLEAQDEIETARATLEVKVEARTEELREFAESLDEKVKEKTKELRERLEELEKFQKLTVGRELKMIALKEEIKKLEKDLEKRSKK
jgi:uncharacterized membrane protein